MRKMGVDARVHVYNTFQHVNDTFQHVNDTLRETVGMCRRRVGMCRRRVGKCCKRVVGVYTRIHAHACASMRTRAQTSTRRRHFFRKELVISFKTVGNCTHARVYSLDEWTKLNLYEHFHYNTLHMDAHVHADNTFRVWRKKINNKKLYILNSKLH